MLCFSGPEGELAKEVVHGKELSEDVKWGAYDSGCARKKKYNKLVSSLALQLEEELGTCAAQECRRANNNPTSKSDTLCILIRGGRREQKPISKQCCHRAFMGKVKEEEVVTNERHDRWLC